MCEERTIIQSGKTRSYDHVNERCRDMMTRSDTHEKENDGTERDQRLDSGLIEWIVHGFRMRVVALLTFPRLASFWCTFRTPTAHELELVGFPARHTDISR